MQQRGMMMSYVVVLIIQIHSIESLTNNLDSSALKSLKDIWQNTPPTWVGSDPCGASWEGIQCSHSRVTELRLSTMGLTGQLSGDIAALTELTILDLSYNKALTGSLPSSIGTLTNLSNIILVGCSFSGPIPHSIGSLKQLVFLSLNSNRFSGSIPPSLGHLSNLYLMDLADNQLSGTIPVSTKDAPGLDMLLQAKHFHFGNNKLSGKIPPQLFSADMKIIHLLLEGNQLNGEIPSTLGLVTTLEVLRLDRNSLSGPIPSTLNSLTNVSHLELSNNKLSGPIPNLTGMSLLNYLDMSNNSFDALELPAWLSTLQSLTTFAMENTQLYGQIPPLLFSLGQLTTVILRNNQLNGTLDISTSSSTQLQLIDLQKNFIIEFIRGAALNFELILVNNPICEESEVSESYCKISKSITSYSTPPNNCVPTSCTLDKVSSPNCACLYPYSGTLIFRAISFSDLGNATHYESLETTLVHSFEAHGLSVDSVSLTDPIKNSNLQVNLQVFPSGVDRFNRTAISRIGFLLSNRTFKPPHVFGPYYFIANEYGSFAASDAASKKSSSIGVIIGAAVGGSVFVLLLILAGVYAFRQKRRAKKATESNPFASWGSKKSTGEVPQLKGGRNFSFVELKKCTNNFSQVNIIGSGGYGKVYRGNLAGGQLVAVKRAQQGSMQGGIEFKTEIELLSRVHHKNLVSLVGFCFDQDEQMLIYEYIPNGNLKESLSGKSGIRLDWPRRLKIALGTARGIAYLHELADPPIIHRDIKSNNILLNERLNAKVADFGLCKPVDDTGKGHVTTQVKGTMGYLDPEYYMTNQLTEKSDVYSYGVVLLEIITAKIPIERGKYIVREVKTVMNKTKDALQIIDPAIIVGVGGDETQKILQSAERLLDLAMTCLVECGVERPTMGHVVKEIESIMQVAGLNPDAESASTSATYESSTQEKLYPYSTGSGSDSSSVIVKPSDSFFTP